MSRRSTKTLAIEVDMSTWTVTSCAHCGGPLKAGTYPDGARVFCAVECALKGAIVAKPMVAQLELRFEASAQESL